MSQTRSTTELKIASKTITPRNDARAGPKQDDYLSHNNLTDKSAFNMQNTKSDQLSSNTSSQVQSVKVVNWNNGVTIQAETGSSLVLDTSGQPDAQNATINNSLNQALEKLENMK